MMNTTKQLSDHPIQRKRTNNEVDFVDDSTAEKAMEREIDLWEESERERRIKVVKEPSLNSGAQTFTEVAGLHRL